MGTLNSLGIQKGAIILRTTYLGALCRVKGLGCAIWGLRFRVQGLGFRGHTKHEFVWRLRIMGKKWGIWSIMIEGTI